MVVKVAIDLALDRLFDYEVPEALQEKLAVGQLLSVPFGHREARGFAMVIRGAEPANQDIKLRPVTAIVEETPFFSAKLLELVKKVAAYTAAPLESVLKAALPAAVLKKNAKPRELMFIEPAIPVEPSNLTKRQAWLYAQIARLGGGWMTQLCEELKTTPNTIKELGRLGLVTVAVRARRRNPLGAKRILPTKPLALNDEQRTALAAIEDNKRTTTRSTSAVQPPTSNLQPVSTQRHRGTEVSKVSPCLCDSVLKNEKSPTIVQAPTSNLQPVLLFGVTGSGKTEVYLQAIAKELAAGRGAIVMVPEISLTPQTVQRFASRFGDRVAVLHSALSDGERYDEWHRIRAGAAQVVVGPRSAVWAPVKNLGLIVVDEEHEASYKQDGTPRYHARDVAVLRGAVEGAKVVLGSATPSLESWHNVEKGKYRLATMKCRAGAGTLPNVRLVEMGGGGDTNGGAIFSRELLEAIKLRLDRHEQTILFLNRRGYSRQLVCDECGWVATCERCDIPYTYHRSDDCCRCHICGGWIETPQACPECKSAALRYQGIGTQRAEAALAKCFPNAAILRMDADSTSRKHSHDDILGAFRNHEADILLGTQMIAKGLDFPNVTLVGVLNADSSINMPDFRAGERSYQLFAQVAGRAGRAELPGEVIIQTHDLESPLLAAVVRGDFAAFAESELQARREGFFPPYSHLAVINFKSQNLKETGDWATMYAKSLAGYATALASRKGQQAYDSKELLVSEAMPSALEKADDWYRWQVVLRAGSAAVLARAWRWIAAARPAPKTLRVAMDIDAYNLI